MVIISKEKFVRDKPHVNIGFFVGIFVVGFALASGLTYVFPDMIIPGYYLLSPSASSLRDTMLHMNRLLLNGAIYGLACIAAVSAGRFILKGKKILQN